MKNNIKLLTIALAALTFSACSGSGEHAGKDTAEMQHTPTNQTDTSAVTKTTGDATNLDNSGSGGTTVAKDSVLKQDSVK